MVLLSSNSISKGISTPRLSPYFRLLMDGYSVMKVTKKRIKVEYWINNNTRLNYTKSELDTEICVKDGMAEFHDCWETNAPSPEPTPSPPDDDDSDNVWMIVAIIFIILFGIVVIGVLIYYYH